MAGEYWDVVYRAVADFGQLMAEAAAARRALKDLSDAAREESKAEVDGQVAATAARKADSAAIRQEIADLAALKAAAEAANVQTTFGGRNSMDQHLSDMQKELQYTDLLNRAHWLNFSSPQQAFSWNQQVLNQRRLMNYADWGGYTTPDQYLNYLVRQRGELQAGNSTLLGRSQVYRELTASLLAYDNALHGTNLTAGQLGGSAAAIASSLSGIPDVISTKIDLDDTTAMAKLAAYRAMLSGIPQVVTTREVLTAGNALGGVARAIPALDQGSAVNRLFENELTRLLAMRPEVTTAMDTVQAEKLTQWRALLQQWWGQAQRWHPVLSAGGASGGGGGPPPGLGTGFPEPDEGDINAYRRLQGAVHDAGEEFHGFEEEASHASDTLHGTVVNSIEDAIRHLESLNITSGKAAAQLAYAIQQLRNLDQGKVNDYGLSNVQQIIDLVTKTHDVADAAKLAYAAVHVYKNGLYEAGDAARMTTKDIAGLSAGFYQAYKVVDQTAVAVAHAGGGFFGLNKAFTLFGGFFGSNHFTGVATGWHLLLAGILDFAAVAVPALSAAVIGLTAFGTAALLAGNTTSALVGNLKAMYVVSQATGAALGPFTGAMQKMQSTIQPMVWQLAGDAMLVLNHNTGTFGTIAQQTGRYVDDLAARITNRLVNSSGQGLLKFFEIGARDLAGFAQLFKGFGSLFDTFVKAAQITQVSEHLLAILGGTVGVVAKALGALPAPLLAAFIALHSSLTYGGLFVTMLQRVSLALDGLLIKFPGATNAALTFAQKIGASSDQLANLAAKSPAMKKLADQLEVTAYQAAQMQQYVKSTGMTMEEFARQTGAGAALMDKYGSTLKDSGKEAVATAIALGGTEQQVSKVAKEAENAAVKTGGLGRVFSSLGGFLANNWVGIAIAAAAGFAFIADKALSATSGTQQFLATLQQTDQQMSAAQLFVTIPDNLGKIQQQIALTNKAWAASTPGLQQLGSSWGSAWAAWRHGFDNAVAGIAALSHGKFEANPQGANPDLNALNNELNNELKTFGAISQTMGGLTKQGYSFSQSLGILNAAGVQVNDSFGVMQTKVQGLLQGYALAGQQAGAVGQDMNALTVTTSQAVTSMGKLNQAWDAWTKIVSGPTDSFLTLDQSMSKFATDSQQAGANMTGLGKVVATTANQSSNSAATLQQDFQTVFSNVQQLFDAVRLSEAAYGGQGGVGDQFTRTVKDSVAALIPLAGKNKAAAAEISALAQEAGGPATLNLQQLAKWAGNVKDPMGQLQAITQKTAEQTYNLSQDASLLTTTLQQELVPQMAGAIIAASKAGPAMQGFATAVFSGHKNVKDLLPNAQTLYDTLLHVAGSTANAHALFIGFAESVGLSHDQAKKLSDQLKDPLKLKVDATPGLANIRNAEQHIKALSIPPSPGGWAGFWQHVSMDFTTWVWHPIHDFLFNLLPSWYGQSNNLIAKSWDTVYQGFFVEVKRPIDHFFTSDMHNWWADVVNKSHEAWSRTANWFNSEVWQSLSRFFTQWIPNWFSSAVEHGHEAWSKISDFFHSEVWDTVNRFFTSDMHNWWADIANQAHRTWSDIANWFTRDVSGPVGRGFDAIAKGMETAFRNSINAVINGVVNKFIGFIDNDILAHLPGGLHIPFVQNVASGGLIYPNGSVPGTGDEDGTHAVMMGGEWILRKPARMALQATFGPDFLPYLNQADTWLGTGSRGNSASQRAPSGSGRFASGGIPGLGTVENWLSTGASWLDGFANWSAGELDKIPGIKQVMGLARNGLASMFNGLWDLGVQPTVDLAGTDTIPGALVHGAAGTIKTGIDNFLTGQQNTAQATVNSATGSVAKSGNVRQEEMYALSKFPVFGWQPNQLPPLISLWNQESGWNPNAVNPTSGAYGIPQALGKGHPYNLGDWATQIDWGLGYIAGRYGSPAGAWAHEVANNWYAPGGPVPEAILRETGSKEIREAMLLGSWLESRWDHKKHDGVSWGPYMINLRANKGVTQTHAKDPTWSTKFMYPHYKRAADELSAQSWARDQAGTASLAYQLAEAATGSRHDKPSPGTLGEGWHAVTEVLSQPVKGPGHNAPEYKKFAFYIDQANKQWLNARADFGELYGQSKVGDTPDQVISERATALKLAAQYAADAKKAKTAAARKKYAAEAAAETAKAVNLQQDLASWESWVAEKLVLSEAGGAVTKAWGTVDARATTNPAVLTNAEFETVHKDLDLFYNLLRGYAAPKNMWKAEDKAFWPKGFKAGHIKPSIAYAQEHFNASRERTFDSAFQAQKDINAALGIWRKYWGERLAHLPPTPGVTVTNPAAPQPYQVNLGPLIGTPPGGTGNAGTGGYAFAAGGPVDVAAMFAAGGSVPMPGFVMPGVSATLQKQLAGASAQQHPRTMSDAAGETVGMKVGNLTINNPVAERPSESITRASNRLAFFAGRGAV